MNLLKKGFTLVELIIALSISALVLIIIFSFVTDTVIQLAETNKNSRFLGDFARFTGRVNSHMSSFSDTSILIDQPESTGNDVLLLKNLEGTDGMVWGVVDAETLKLLPNTKYTSYQNAVMGYRLVSSVELSDIAATPLNIYNYTFFGDKVFSDFKVKGFQAVYFNGTDIMSVDLSIVPIFEEELIGISWNMLPKDTLFKVNLNF